MKFLSPQRRSPLRTPAAQFEIKSPLNRHCRGHHEGLDDETENSDFPVEGELFLLTSPFIELPHALFLVRLGAAKCELRGFGWHSLILPRQCFCRLQSTVWRKLVAGLRTHGHSGRSRCRSPV
jgi:hypothetical protein